MYFHSVYHNDLNILLNTDFECVLVSTWGSAARPVPQEEQRTDRSGTDPDSEDPPDPGDTSQQAFHLSICAHIIQHSQNWY